MAYFFVAEDSDDAVFADFGLAGGGGGVVVFYGEFDPFVGDDAPCGFSFAPPIDVHAGDAALFGHELVMPAEAGDAGDDGLVGGGVEGGGVGDDFEDFADAGVVAGAGFDVGEVLADGGEAIGFGAVEVAELFVSDGLCVHDGLGGVADGADSADEAADAWGIPSGEAGELHHCFFGEVESPIVEVFGAVWDDVFVHFSVVFWFVVLFCEKMGAVERELGAV